MCLEEGTQSSWLYEVLEPHAAVVVVVCGFAQRGSKSDEKDAFWLAEQLRIGAIERRVFKGVGEFRQLRELSRVHTMVVRDVVRVQTRIRSMVRSCGVRTTERVYSRKSREAWLEKLPEVLRVGAKRLYEQYDAIEPIRRHAFRRSSPVHLLRDVCHAFQVSQRGGRYLVVAAGIDGSRCCALRLATRMLASWGTCWRFGAGVDGGHHMRWLWTAFVFAGAGLVSAAGCSEDEGGGEGGEGGSAATSSTTTPAGTATGTGSTTSSTTSSTSSTTDTCNADLTQSLGAPSACNDWVASECCAQAEAFDSDPAEATFANLKYCLFNDMNINVDLRRACTYAYCGYWGLVFMPFQDCASCLNTHCCTDFEACLDADDYYECGACLTEGFDESCCANDTYAVFDSCMQSHCSSDCAFPAYFDVQSCGSGSGGGGGAGGNSGGSGGQGGS